MKLKTAELRELVAPAELEDILETLLQKGDIEKYVIKEAYTTIKPSKHGEVKLFIREESVEIQNSRPYVKRKNV